MVPNFLNASHLVVTYGYIGIFLIVLIESGIFFFLPGDSLLFIAGIVSASGQLNVLAVILLAITGGFLGNIAGFWIGGRLLALREVKFFRPLISEARLKEAHEFFEKYGSKALVLARFVPAGRTFVPWAAGAAGMEKGKYSRFSFIGALIWALIMTLAGYFLGRSFPEVETYLSYIIIGIVILSVVPIALEWMRRRRKKARG